MVIDAPHRIRSSRGLGRALRVAGASPRPYFRAALISAAGTALLTLLMAQATRPRGVLPGPQRALIVGALAVFCVAAVLGLATIRQPSRPGGRWADRVVPPTERAAIWLALAIWVPFLLVPAYLLAKSTEPVTVQWNTFGFLDKRWETTAYLVGVLGPMLALLFASRVLRAARAGASEQAEQAEQAGSPERAGSPEQAGSAGEPRVADSAETAGARARLLARVRWEPVARVTAMVLTAAALAWYFYGPPWYLDRSTAYITHQDDVWLGGLQAMSKGHIPFIGPGAIQYGPGTQLLSYLYMRDIGPFSVLGFRESWALFQWAGATIVFVALFLAFGYLRGLIAALLAALVYPTLQLLGFQPGLTYGGLFGWASPLRYAGAFTLIVLLPAVIRCPGWRGRAAGIGLGLAWGALCYAAQENLIAGVVGALVIAALLLLSGTSSARSVAGALLAVAAGSLAAWLPVLGYYAAHGSLGRFAWLYFLVPRAVAGGYSNTPFKHGLHNPWARTFYVFPFVLAALALASVLRFRPLRVAVGWSRQRIMLVSVLVATAVLYEGALLRSDTAHLSGTMLAVPALVAVAATSLPGRIGARRPVTVAIAGAAIVAAAFALLPGSSYRWSAVQARLAAPYLDRERLAGRPDRPAPGTLAGQRVGAGLAVAPVCCRNSTLGTRGFIPLMDRLHAIIGNRRTYVTDFPDGYPGLVYFTADLNPAPIPLEPYTMVLDQPQLVAYRAALKASVLPDTRALVTSSLADPQTSDFLAMYPTARRITLSYLGKPYYVLLGAGGG